MDALPLWKGPPFSLPECGESVTRFLTTLKAVLNTDMAISIFLAAR